MSQQPPRTRPPARRVNTAPGPGPQPPRRPTNVNAPRQRDPFPYVLGGVLALMVVGIFVVVFLLSQSSGGTTATPTAVAQATKGTTDVGNPPTANPGEGAAPTASGSTPPRMPVADFKALYDNPAKRPLIIDVRAKEAFTAGHITGAESYPESDIDATAVKLPKDKLIVAYCQ